MPFIFNKQLNFYISDNKYYLFFDSDYWGESLRLGDFVMASTLLYIAKKNLINTYSKLDDDNFFFIFNNKSRESYINDLPRMLKIFKNVYDGKFVKNLNTKHTITCNVNQIYPNGNLWQFKDYLANCNFSLTQKDGNIITPEGNVNELDKNTIYVLPVRGKLYNIERNWSLEFILNILKDIDSKTLVKLIAVDNYRLHKDEIHTINKFRPKNLKILNNKSWYDIINGVTLTCKEFISGDCGMMHFVCALAPPFRPNSITCYYKTKGLSNSCQYIKNIANYPEHTNDQVNFKPYPIYTGSNLIIKDF